MSVSAKQLRRLIKLHSLQFSMQQAAKAAKLSSSTVKKYFDRIEAAEISWDQAKAMNDEALITALQPVRRLLSNYAEPDWDEVHLSHRGKRIPLSHLWAQYRSRVPDTLRALSYASFCRNYDQFQAHLPSRLADITATFEWQPGEVVMIDYSGDPMYLVDKETHELRPVQIFVAVMPYSNYTFCFATPRQTRDDWLDGLVELMNHLQGVPQYIYLDNSTSLVIKADRVSPKVCEQFEMFCEHYGTTPFPVSPNKPRHKAAVEGAVRLCQERCMRPLVGYPFATIEELNEELQNRCREHNQTPFAEKWRQTREMRFEEEKPYLNPLPPTPYEKSQIVKILKVRKDSLIRFEEKRYSVPAGFIGKKVRVCIQPRAGTLKIYSDEGKLIAQHPIRSGTRLSVNIEHLPEHLRRLYMSNEMRREQIASTGPNAAALAEAFGALKKHVAAKHLMGLQIDIDKYGAELFEKVCEWVVERKKLDWEAYQRGIDEIIHGGAQRRKKQWTRNFSTHEDVNRTIRGADYFKDR